MLTEPAAGPGGVVQPPTHPDPGSRLGRDRSLITDVRPFLAPVGFGCRCLEAVGPRTQFAHPARGTVRGPPLGGGRPLGRPPRSGRSVPSQSLPDRRGARDTLRRTPSGTHASVQWGARRRADRPRQPAGVPAPGIIRAQHIPTAAQSVGRTAPAAARPHARDSAVRRLLHWCNTNHAASTVLMSNCGALCSDWTVRPIWAPLRPVRHHSGHPGPRQVSF